jgi:hypothetical protein
VYSIYRVFDLGPSPRFYKLTGDMQEILDLTPVSYQARVKVPGARPAADDVGLDEFQRRETSTLT